MRSRAILGLLALLLGCRPAAPSGVDFPSPEFAGPAAPAPVPAEPSEGERRTPIPHAAEEAEFAERLASAVEAGKQAEASGDYIHAEQTRRAAFDLIETRYGSNSWQTEVARGVWERSRRLARFTPAEQARWEELRRLRLERNRAAKITRFAEAVRHARECVAISQSLWGDHGETADDHRRLAQLLMLTGETAEAEQELARCVTLARAALGRRHPEFVRAAALYGEWLLESDEPAGAVPLLEEVLTAGGDIWSHRGTEYAELLLLWGKLQNALGSAESAAAALARAGELFALELPGSRPRLGEARYELGMAFRSQEAFEKARVAFAEAYELWSEEFGGDDPRPLQAASELGAMQLALGQPREAEALFSIVAEARERTLGGRDLSYAAALHSLAIAYGNQAKYAEAEPLMQRVIAIQRAELEANHPELALSFKTYAALLRAAGRIEEAAGLEAGADPPSGNSFERR